MPFRLSPWQVPPSLCPLSAVAVLHLFWYYECQWQNRHRHHRRQSHRELVCGWCTSVAMTTLPLLAATSTPRPTVTLNPSSSPFPLDTVTSGVFFHSLPQQACMCHRRLHAQRFSSWSWTWSFATWSHPWAHSCATVKLKDHVHHHRSCRGCSGSCCSGDADHFPLASSSAPACCPIQRRARQAVD